MIMAGMIMADNMKYTDNVRKLTWPQMTSVKILGSEMVGFGVVYKGQLSKQWPDHEVAIKRLNKTGHHVNTEFLNELNMISRFHHQNIIRFIVFCNERDEMIFVYEYAVNGSLESHLENPNKIRCLTWVKRLKICLGAAKGLDYLHSGLREKNRVIHRDVKSGNILLDDNLEAKICDFGFSKSDSTKNLQQSQLYTKVAGLGYNINVPWENGECGDADYVAA
ncbi:protein kinase, ATP binding site-containing protein [Tanacetum coccineum]